MAELGPVTLNGRGIRLEPLRQNHTPGLAESAQYPQIWTHIATKLLRESEAEDYLNQALAAQGAGRQYPFAAIDLRTERLIGSTRYLDVDSENRTVEIGATWYFPGCWGTSVNPEAKLLLMSHAFEEWRAIRVCLKTDVLNLHSQAAIRKLGAVYEGTLRNDRIRPDGTLRDTVVFSITKAEWPAVKEGLERRLEQ